MKNKLTTKLMILITLIAMIMFNPAMVSVAKLIGDDIPPAIYDPYPEKGDSTSNILIMIRIKSNTTKTTFSNTNAWVYVFWDDKPIIIRQPAIYHKDATYKYERRWDLYIKAPQEYPYNSEGTHDIDIMVEWPDGKR